MKADLVLINRLGVERHRFHFSSPRRAWQACNLVRSQLRSYSRQVLVLGDLPGDTGFKVNANDLAQANVESSTITAGSNP